MIIFQRMEIPLLVRHEDILAKGSKSKIPQVDGLMPDPYDEMLSTPNVCSSILYFTYIYVISVRRSLHMAE